MGKTLKMVPATLAACVAALLLMLCLAPGHAFAADMSNVYGVLCTDGSLVIQDSNTAPAGKTLDGEAKKVTGEAQLKTLFDAKKVKTVSVEIDIDVKTNGFFKDLEKCTAIDVANDKSVKLAADASEMFAGCWNLATLEVARFDTAAVTNMSLMFYSCESLSTLDLTSFDTAAVTNMNSMFSNCNGLSNLNLSSFNTKKVTTASDMFKGCGAIRTIELGANFAFKSDSARLPHAYWSDQAGKTFSSSTIPNDTAATYTRTSMALQPMYRVYNKWSGEHFFTNSAEEHDTLVEKGWTDEHIAWYSPEQSNTPVYRLYNEWSGEHHFTTSKSEYDKCVKDGWTGENVAFYSGGNNPVYRLYNPYEKAFYHHYTMSQDEKDTCIKNGWKDEEVGWYCY